MNTRHLFHYALTGLRQGRQRTLIAVLSVAFGVMAVVAMATLSDVIADALFRDPRYVIGGDARLWRETSFLTAEHLAQAAAAEEDGGTIAAWTPVAGAGSLMLTMPDSGHVTFLRQGLGFDPAGYPLMGEFVLQSGATVTDTLRTPGDIIITPDIAASRDLAPGDTVLVTNQLGGEPVSLRVGAVAAATPSQWGSSIYYSLETAALLADHPAPITDVVVDWAPAATPEKVAATRAALADAGWQIYAPDTLSPRDREMQTMFNLMLKGAGVMGLMVGGIGIANMMQVLLRRRREEVGVLKTLGYARRDIMHIFGTEAVLIGLAGSVPGVVAGVTLSTVLVRVISNLVTLFLVWRVNVILLIGSVGVGVLTTLLFAANAILQASDLRPADVFRHLPAVAQNRRRAIVRSVGTFALLALPFWAVATLVLGSLWQGAAVLGAALAGLVFVGSTLAGLKWLALRLLPTGHFHLLRMARNNMRRRGFSLVFAMIALFVGTFTFGLALIIVQTSVDQFQTRMLTSEGYNLLVLTGTEGADEAAAVLSSHCDSVGVRYETPLLKVESDAGAPLAVSRDLQGRTTLWDVTIEGAPWGSGGAYLPASLFAEGAAVPETVTVTGLDGAQMTLPVAGTYAVSLEWDRYLLPAAGGVLVDRDTLLAFDAAHTLTLVAAAAPPAQMAAVAEEVGRALPAMLVVTAADVNDSFNATFKNLFAFAVLMAGLALVAGAVLIANAVSLAMIERRQEIGVLKAMGYSRRQVLRMILLEYGLVAAIAATLGVVAVVVFIAVAALNQDLSMVGELLAVTPLSGLVIVGAAVGLSLAAALSAAWEPTSVRPVVVLNTDR